jgi:hypothetical protein
MNLPAPPSVPATAWVFTLAGTLVTWVAIFNQSGPLAWTGGLLDGIALTVAVGAFVHWKSGRVRP